MAETDPHQEEGAMRLLRNTTVVRAATLLIVALALQIPIDLIGSTTRERQGYREQAVRAVADTWGAAQIVRGPFLAIPYSAPRATPGGSDGKSVLWILPEKLEVDGDLETEVRRRGLFDIPLYLGRLSLRGSLRLPDAGAFPPNAAVQWGRATLIVAISDTKALRADAALGWGDSRLPMQAGSGFDLYPTGINAVLPLTEAAAGSAVPFSLELQLAGSGGFSLLPAGAETTVRLRSNAPDPSFIGSYSPATRTVSADGFDARWEIPRLARPFPSTWKCGEVRAGDLDAALFGVTLFPPVDAYRGTERALKYDLLFIGLTFLAFFAFEQRHGRPVTVVQYLLVGLALCLFYLLLLSLAEHLGFALAYATAAAAITVMIALYGRAVLDGSGRGAAIASLLASLYGYLYVLLQLEDLALLAGALGLAAILAVAMYLTRRVNAPAPLAVPV